MFYSKIVVNILHLHQHIYFCEKFSNFVCTLIKEEESDDKYPWFDKNYERGNMSDREILE